MILETRRLILRPFEESDAESVYQYAKDPAVGPIAGWPQHTDVENSRSVIRDVLMAPEIYAICPKTDSGILGADGQRPDSGPIGAVSLKTGEGSNIALQEDEGEIGFWLGVPFWGQGIMPEAVRELIRHAFADLKYTTIWCGYFDGNEKSRRCQDKCGFHYHHTDRDIYWPLMDDIRTEHIQLLTREEWKNGFDIRKLEETEIPSALDLVARVFMVYEAPDYSPEGTEEILKCLKDEKFLAGIDYLGVYDGNTLVGIAGVKSNPAHITFFFVEGRYHRLGLGTRLMRRVFSEYPADRITLRSSPYGLPFYKTIGFTATDSEKTENGIRFTPMVYER